MARRLRLSLRTRSQGDHMLDVVFTFTTLLFFALTWAYGRGCERI